MPRFFLKPIVWNSNNYKAPSGDKSSKDSFPGEHGYGYEEWNNSPAMEFELEKQRVRAFNIQGLGNSGVEESAGANFIFMYASHGGNQRLVGVAGNATCLTSKQRTDVADRLKTKDFWKDAWASSRVRECYDGDRKKFLSRWREHYRWLPSWTCPSDLFFWPEEPVILNSMNVTGKPKLLTMFSSYTAIDPRIAKIVMNAVPNSQRTQRWTNIVEAINAPNSDTATDIEDLQNDDEIGDTTRHALVNARIGQGRFRTDLEDRWDRMCAVTGCSVGQVLRASHIKPWSESSNRERLDPHNGLLLSANLDALFDRGLISFAKDGAMILSSKITPKQRKMLGVPMPLRRSPDESEQKFLSFHRKYWGL